MKPVIGVLCIFLGVVVANPNQHLGLKSAAIFKRAADTFDELGRGEQISLINEFVDMALDEAKYFMIEQGYDPMHLPDLYEKISFKPIIITYWGSLNLTKGTLTDASTIERNGDVSLDYTDRILTLQVPIKFEALLIDYRYKVKIMGLGPRGGVHGKCKNIRISFTLALDFERLRVDLRKFDIDRIGRVGLTFSGNILTDWLVNLVSGVISILFKGIIKWVLEIIVRDVLVSLCDAINEILSQLVPDPTVVGSVGKLIVR